MAGKSRVQQNDDTNGGADNQDTNGSATTSASDPAGVANASTIGGEGARAENSQMAEEVLNREPTANASKPLSQLEAMQASAIGARQSATDATLGASSEVIQRPGAEMLAGLTTDAKTAQREQMHREVAEGGETAKGAEYLGQLQDEVEDAQRELENAMKRRDMARDLLDREAQRLAVNGEGSESRQFADYQAAMNRMREDTAKRNAAAMKSAA